MFPGQSVRAAAAASGRTREVASPRVLVVDDDESIRRFLDIALRVRGFDVFEASGARAALDAVATVRPDVIILDLGLPDGDGVDVTKQLHAADHPAILVLSVRDQEQDKVAALEAGAEDYLTKPFGVEELHARLRVLMRRRAARPPAGLVRTGELEVDLERRLVKVEGKAVHLTPTEYALLKALVEADGRVLTHGQLLHQVWGPAYASEGHLLRVNISNLRRKIERDPAAPRYLVTEPRVGYRFNLES
jgi:two-component system, OmpR family, KDP operon response regulator KdpE